MSRQLKDPNQDNILEWTERVTDADGDTVATSLVLDAINDGNGFTSDGRDSSNVSWLSYSVRSNILNDGTKETLLDIEVDKTQLQVGYIYRFKATADDGIKAVDRIFTLSIRKPGGEYLHIGNPNNMWYRTLGTPYDILSTTNTSSFEKLTDSTGNDALKDVRWKEDGKKMVLFGNQFNSFDNIRSYDAGTPFDPSTLTQTGAYNTGGAGIESGTVKQSGNTIFAYTSTPSTALRKFSTSTPWEIDSLTEEQTYDPPGPIAGIGISNDGKDMILYIGERVEHYTMDPGFDLSTMTFQDEKTGLPNARHVSITKDGLNMLLTSSSYIRKYSFGTNWDTNTLTQEQELSNNTESNNLRFAVFAR
jgi:hypothetical protein